MNVEHVIKEQDDLIYQLLQEKEMLLKKLEERNEELYQYKIKFGPIQSASFNRRLRVLHRAEEDQEPLEIQ